MRKCVLGLALGSCIAVVASCGLGTSPATEAEVEQAAQPLRPGSYVALTDIRPVPAKGRFLVTPRWSPGGDRLLLSGWRGIGLHTLDLATGAFQDVDTKSRTRSTWDAAGQVTADALPGEDGQWRLFDREGVGVLYRPYNGTIEAVTPSGAVEIASGGAWGVRVAPDGKRVAYCTGHLPTGRLRIVDLGGTVVFDGPGVHPAWLPARAGLIYAVPEPALAVDGMIELGASELYAIGAPSWTPLRLTDTPEVLEMEPAISPQGDRLAFSDWKTGTLSLARLAETGGGQ